MTPAHPSPASLSPTSLSPTSLSPTSLSPTSLAIGGAGGLFLLPSPGSLVVELHKRDLGTTRNPTDLRAFLVGPDRRPLDEAVIEGDSEARLTTTVDTPGIYVVMVTLANDRYGEHVRWGFRTNAQKYLIETSRGHRDARHLEPIVLDTPGTAQDVCFRRHLGAVAIEAEGLDPAGPAPRLFDGAGEPAAELPVSAAGAAELTLPALSLDETALGDASRPWRLHLPGGVGTIHIDGVTRWERGDAWDGLSLWSPRRKSFFALHDLRWMLTPYHHAFAAAEGVPHDVTLRLHNNGSVDDTLTLTVEASDLDIRLSQTQVVLAAGAAARIAATVTVPVAAAAVDTLTARVRVSSANHPEVHTWSTLEARVGTATSTSFEPPLVYRPWEHENSQLAYTPDYPNANQIYTAPDGTAFTIAGGGLARLDAGGWRHLDLAIGDRRYRPLGSKVGFGDDGAVCLLGQGGGETVYLHSSDKGDTFIAAPLPGSTAPTQYDIETFTGHNLPAGPAPFVRATQTSGADAGHFWRRVNDLELFLPSWEKGQLTVGEPIPVSSQALGISSHSGVPAALASRGERVHIIWGEATDADTDAPGVPAMVVTWDRGEGRFLGEPACVGYGPPANDVHNTPSLTIDSRGFLHTLTGTHGSPFAYARSLSPDTAHDGFTEPEPVEDELRSTYVGLVCGPDDALHLVFRAWSTDGVYHPVSHYANLGYKRKPADGPWSPMQRLAVAPFPEYSIWYHRLTIDRRGRLLLSFDYWSTYWFYRTDRVGDRRKTVLSADGGQTWQLLETADLR